MIDELARAVVKIVVRNSPGGPYKTTGTGFFIRSDGYLITCHHVIQPLEALLVEYRGALHTAEWCQDLSAPDVDIAILKIAVTDAEVLNIVDPTILPSAVVAYGFARSKQQNFPDGFDIPLQGVEASAAVNTASVFRSRGMHETDFPWGRLPSPSATFTSHRISAAVEEGMSGGPVFSERLRGAVGVIQSVSNKSGVSYLVRWENVRQTLLRLEIEPRARAIDKYLKAVSADLRHTWLFDSVRSTSPLYNRYVQPRFLSRPLDQQEDNSIAAQVQQADPAHQSSSDHSQISGNERDTQKRVPASWKDIQQKANCIFVLADSGMGKTTLIGMEALKLISKAREQATDPDGKADKCTLDKCTLPLLLYCSELDGQEDFFEAIPSAIRRRYPLIEQGFEEILNDKLKDGTCQLFLDALDRVPRNKRRSFLDRLGRFARVSSCRIICTSRIVGYTPPHFSDVHEVWIEPFGRMEVEDYVTRWFAGGSDKNSGAESQAMLCELYSRNWIHGLVGTPLMLSLLCGLYGEQGVSLLTRRSYIYERAVTYMLNTWSARRTPHPDGWIQAKIHLAEYLAHHFLVRDLQFFSSGELYECSETFLHRPDVPSDFRNKTTSAIIAELAEEDGIIVLDSPSERYCFVHLSFQEYLAASYLAQSPGWLAEARKHFFQPQWVEPLALLAGMKKNPLPLLDAILAEDDDLFDSMLKLAALCLAEGRAALVDGTMSSADRHTLRDREQWVVRRLCASKVIEQDDPGSLEQILVRLGGPQVISMLIPYLRGEHAYFAARVLGRIGNDQLVPSLAEALKNGDRSFRAAMAQALVEIGGETAVKTLLQLLEDLDNDPEIVKALSGLGQQSSVLDVIIHMLSSDNDQVREAAVTVLGRMEPHGVEELLLEILRSDPVASVRAAAIGSLARIGGPAVIQDLTTALADDAERVRAAAAEALGELGVEAAVEPLMVLLVRENEVALSSASMAAAKSLGKLARPGDLQRLADILDPFRDERIRHGGQRLLNEIEQNREHLSEESIEFIGRMSRPKCLRDLVSKCLRLLFTQNNIRPFDKAMQNLTSAYGVDVSTEAGFLQTSTIKSPHEGFSNLIEFVDTAACVAEFQGKIDGDGKNSLDYAALRFYHDLMKLDIIETVGKALGFSLADIVTRLEQDDSFPQPDEFVFGMAMAYKLGQELDWNSLLRLVTIFDENAVKWDEKMQQSSCSHYFAVVYNAVRIDGAFPTIMNSVLAFDVDGKMGGRKFACIEALAEIGGWQAAKYLVNSIDDGNFLVRRSCVVALARCATPRVVDVLLKALQTHSDSVVRGIAASHLGGVNRSDVKAALIAALNASDEFLRWNAADALGQLGDLGIVSHLLPLLENSSRTVRCHVASALGRIGEAAAVEMLVDRLLEDPEWSVREACASALGDIGHPQAVPGLASSLRFRTRNGEHLGAIIDALGRIGSDEAISALLALLDHQDKWIRNAVKRALRQVCQERHIGIFKKRPSGLLHRLLGKGSGYEIRKIDNRDRFTYNRAHQR